MSWLARLDLDYAHRAGRTALHFEHEGPLRVLRSLYPEGPAICHNVLVHPPGGLVGGDTLDIRVNVQPGAHALVTTPGAARFYRTDGAPATQRSHLAVQEGARLEWLPLEALAYSGCDAVNHTTLELAPGAECLGWDLVALGLPHAQQPFVQGRYAQQLELPGQWLERGVIEAGDARLLDGPLGLAGQRCLATLFFVAGTPLERQRREQALELTRSLIEADPLGATCGVTSPHAQVLVLRGLAPVVEPAMRLWQTVWAAWRQHFWDLQPERPRIWSM